MKIAIVGAGFCGLAVAWYLLNHPAFSHISTLSLFDGKGIGGGASGIAAGLLHPFVGAHSKLNARGHEGMQCTKELLQIAALALNRSVTDTNVGILRLACTEKQRDDFLLCATQYPEYTQWLDAPECQVLAEGCGNASGLFIKGGMTVYSPLYLQGLWKACQSRGLQFVRQTVNSLKEVEGFDLTIVAAGADTAFFPEFSNLPLRVIKGQVLELSWPKNRKPLACALNSHVYIVMTESKTSCLVGATYEKVYTDKESNRKKAEEELLPKAYEVYPALRESEILHCYVGMRVTTQQRVPLARQIAPSQWVITGMGSKGLLYHAICARDLVEEIALSIK